VLFTAFEPSGDEHAGAVIAELRTRRPDIAVFAAGGPKMRAAGAQIILDTTHDAVMGVPGIGKVLEHRRSNKRIACWLDAHRIALHMPVDSPAANFPIARLAGARGVPVFQLVAPQLWAWAPWRIGKTRRLIDKLLCILPFEEGWFRDRGVDAEYVGHPIFGEALDDASIDAVVATLPPGERRLAILPGSRPGEIERNYPAMLGAFVELSRRHPGLTGVVAATNDRLAARINEINRQRAGGEPAGLQIVVGQADAVIRWSSIAVATSGTVTLRVCRHGRPLVAMFRVNPWLWSLVGRWLIRTPFILLPNIIMGREIIPELAPYTGGPGRLIGALDALLGDEAAQRAQVGAQRELSAMFGDRNAAGRAAELIDQAIERSSDQNPCHYNPASGL
jgi:lipid-A-disaccharide synthase